MSLKVGSGQINQMQQSLLELQKLRIADAKKEIFELKLDKKEISEDALNLKNIDSEKSQIDYNNQVIDFNFVFNIHARTELKVKGFVKTEEKILEVEFSYQFQREIAENNKIITREFLLTLKMKANFEETIPFEKRKDKEEILSFIQRLANEIFDTFNDHTKSLREIIINQEDLKKITKAGKDDLARLLQSLLGAVFSFVKFKEMSSRDNPRVGIIIHTDIEKHEAKEYSVTKIQSFTVEIKQVDSKENLEEVEKKTEPLRM